MQSRELRGLEIAARFRITRDGELWSVPSQSGPRAYRVDLSAGTCTCPDYEDRQLPCKHQIAAALVRDREGSAAVAVSVPSVPTTDREPLPPKKRPTYKQVWSAYNRAQVREKRMFQELLRDLCAGLPGPTERRRGQQPVLLSDAIFAACFKVYSTFSGRRFMTDLSDAAERGYLSKALHYNSIFKLMGSATLTPILRQLIAESAKPLASVEVDFAADSSAFSGSRFERWYDVKHNRAHTEHAWTKLQMACGVKTNIVSSAVICEQDGPDSPYLPQLVNETAANFTVNEFSADKGYSSTYGHDAVAAVGGTPFIAFKKSATGGSGGLWEKMYHYFAFRKDEFLAHYHKRSNAETVFSMVKAKFGDAIRSKSRTAMVNEVLLKILAHNLCVLVQEIHELGIAPAFWSESCPPKEGGAHRINGV